MIWTLVSAFLAATAMFFAAMLADNTQRRLALLMRGYIAARADRLARRHRRLFPRCSAAPPTLFLLYERARGTFKDPNVLGAFLVLPGLLIVPAHAGRAVRARPQRADAAGDAVAALLLSFSRAAWGQFAFAALILMALTFLTSRSANERAAHRRRRRSPACW